MRIVYFMMVVMALHGCATGVAAGYGQGGRDADGRTYQEARADNRITAAVNTALVREALPALNIDVQTLNGVVTLSGRVTDYEVALRAAAVARNVPGVKEVRNQLRIAR